MACLNEKETFYSYRNFELFCILLLEFFQSIKNIEK